MVRYVKNEGRPALGFAVESEESDESSDDEPLSDQPSLATLVTNSRCPACSRARRPTRRLGLEMSGAARELRRRSTGRLRGSVNEPKRL